METSHLLYWIENLLPSKESVIKILSIVKENNEYPRLDSFLANLLKYLYKKPNNTKETTRKKLLWSQGFSV